MRLFVAVPVPREVKEALESAQERLAAPGVRVRWVRPEGIHLTLRFLGEVAEEKVEELRAALRDVREAPFDMSVKGIGFFPDARKPRVVWAGVEEGSGRLEALQGRVETCVRSLGFEPERGGRFHPHLTIGRTKDPRRAGPVGRAAEGTSELDFGAIRAESFALFRSELRPEGARYTVLESYPLREQET